MLQSAIRADGVRRLTLAMRAETIKADGFAGLPRGTAKPFEILATFEQALPYLHLPAKTFLLVSFLVDLTRAIDWEETSRPIAWPSNDRLIEFARRLATTAQGLNPRALRSRYLGHARLADRQALWSPRRRRKDRRSLRL